MLRNSPPKGISLKFQDVLARFVLVSVLGVRNKSFPIFISGDCYGIGKVAHGGTIVLFPAKLQHATLKWRHFCLYSRVVKLSRAPRVSHLQFNGEQPLSDDCSRREKHFDFTAKL